MSDPKPQADVRPYAVRDALEPAALPRVVIHTSPSAAVSHVVGARFSAAALNAMEVLALAAQGARVEDPRCVLPTNPTAPPTGPGATLPPDLGPCPPAGGQIVVGPLDPPYLPAALDPRSHPDFLAALAADESPVLSAPAAGS